MVYLLLAMVAQSKNKGSERIDSHCQCLADIQQYTFWDLGKKKGGREYNTS